MSEEIKNTEENKEVKTGGEAEVKQPTADELMSQIADLSSKLEAAEKAKKDILAEAKSAKAKAKEVESASETIETVREQLNAAITEKDNAFNSLVSRLRDREVTSVVNGALTEAECLSPRLMAREVMDRIDAEYDAESGEVKITVKDAAGKPMFVKGKEATVADLVKELRDVEEFASMFKGVQQGGTGSTAPRKLAADSQVENPFKTGNREGQYKLKKENPELFKQWKAEHDAEKAKGQSTFAHGMR